MRPNGWVVNPLLAVAALVCAMPHAAFAQSPPTDPDTEIARRHFDKGTAFYTEGKYAEAIGEFEAARKVKRLPAFDYNIARCQDRLEHVTEAITGYERYLAAIPPTDPDAAEVRVRVAVLKQRLAESAPARPIESVATTAPATVPPSVATAPPVEPAPLARPRRWTWIVGSTGAALLVGSLAAGLVANARYNDLKPNCAPDGACNGATVPSAQSWIDNGRGAGLASDVLLGVGVAAVTAGVVLYFIEGRRPVERQTWWIAPTINAGGAGLAFEVVR